MVLFGTIAKIALPCQNVGRAPVHLDDPAIGASVDADPIARPVGAAEIQDDAREHITERALQRQSKNNRDNTGGREQALDWQIEDVGDDRENRGEVDQPDKQILDQLALARTALGNDKGAQKADHEPRGPSHHAIFSAAWTASWNGTPVRACGS
jgi:hypothetical protein